MAELVWLTRVAGGWRFLAVGGGGFAKSDFLLAIYSNNVSEGFIKRACPTVILTVRSAVLVRESW